jgi:hypothetical protein
MTPHASRTSPIHYSSATACRKYTVTASRGRYWRRCGLGVWASATTRDVKRTATQVANTVDRGLDRVAETTRARVETAREHLGNAADAASESIDNVIDRVRGTLTAAQENMVRRARELVANVNTNWREIKRTISETGAYRFVQRTWFNDNAPKNPLLVFKGLASRMEREGFSAEDNLLERALFKADAAVFRDYTRVLSIREALFAFCKKNAGVKGVMEHMRNVVRNDEAFTARTRQTPDIEVPASMRGKRDLSQDDSRFTMTTDETENTAGFRPERDFAKNGIRKAAVDRELSAKDPNGATMGDADALELYSLLSEQVIERFEHIQRMARMVATRFQRLNKATWTALTAAQKEEYRRYFFSLRRLAGGLKTLLVQINHGDGPIKRSIVRGTQWLSTKVASVCDNLKAKMAAQLNENDWAISSKFYLTVQLGAAFKVPVLPGAPSAKVEGGIAMGFAAIVATKHLENSEKTYSSTYWGAAIDVQVVFNMPSVVIAKMEERRYAERHYCVRKFGTFPCTETFWLLMVVFPGNFGLSQRVLLPAMRAVMGLTILSDVSQNELASAMDPESSGSWFGGGSAQDIVSLSQQFVPSGEEEPLPTLALNSLKAAADPFVEAVYPTSPGAEDTAAVEPQHRAQNMADAARTAMNAILNYGPSVYAMTTGLLGGKLGVLSFLYTYKVGSGDAVLRGVDKVFVKPFFEGIATGMGGITNKISTMLANAGGKVKVELKLQPGPLIWLVLAGGAKRAVANAATAANAASENTANLAVAAGDEHPCDQSFIASRLTSLREAVHIAKRGDETVRADVLAALKDMEDYERECRVGHE